MALHEYLKKIISCEGQSDFSTLSDERLKDDPFLREAYVLTH